MAQLFTNRGLSSRRQVLQNTALMAFLAPVMRTLEARAAATSQRRVILIFMPNGPMMAAGPASGTETNFTLHDWWSPLERHKSSGIFMSHMAATGTGVVSGGGHGLGGQIFGGYGGGFGGDQYRQNGETIDQVIARRLVEKGTAGVQRSVVWGNVTVNQGGGTGDAFASGPGRNISPESDPSRAYAGLFSSFMPPATTPAAMNTASAAFTRDKTMLNFVAQDCQAMRDTLGAEGMRLLADHCSTLSAMEKNLITPPTTPSGTSGCKKPADPGAKDWPNPENVDAQSKSFFDLTAAALACELTAVVAYQFGAQGARNRLSTKYGVPSSPQADSGDSGPAHHPWTHQGSSSSKQQALEIFQRFYSTQIAILLDNLKNTNDAAGKPLLDSTLVVCASELGGNPANGDAHQTISMPVMMFGNGQGTFRTGRYIKGKSGNSGDNFGATNTEAGRDMARMLVSVMQYMGLTDVNTVGVTGVSGGLSWLK
jgi:Protein of unknown function (DUF1552)